MHSSLGSVSVSKVFPTVIYVTLALRDSPFSSFVARRFDVQVGAASLEAREVSPCFNRSWPWGHGLTRGYDIVVLI